MEVVLHPVLSLLAGSLAAVAIASVGAAVLKVLRVTVAGPFGVALEMLTGVLGVGLLVLLLATSGMSGVLPMRVLAAGALLTAAAFSSRWARRARELAVQLGSGRTWLFALPALCLLAALLVGGAEPASRMDETGYHALVGTRLLHDGALRYHPLPWEASVIVQLAWHYALVPLFAVSGTAPGGVVSAWVAGLLALLVAERVVAGGGSRGLGAVASACVLCGGYSAAFFTALGPHAFQSLATFVAVAAFGWSVSLREQHGLRGWAALAGIGAAAMLAAKIPMLPLAAWVLAYSLFEVLRQREGGKTSAAALLVVPTLAAFVLPASIAFIGTGSPFGALSAAAFKAHRVFDTEALWVYDSTRVLFAGKFGWRFELAYWNLPLLLAPLAALTLEPAERRWRWWLVAALQAATLVLLLPPELRHMGGVQYVLLAAALAALARRLGARPRRQLALVGLTLAATLPWLVFSAWVLSIYVAPFVGVQSRDAFLARYSGLYADYAALDRILPSDAKILIGHSRSNRLQAAWYGRPPTLYATRPVIYESAEVRAGDRVFLLYVGAGGESPAGPIPLDPWLPTGLRLGKEVYRDAKADFYPSRTPRNGEPTVLVQVFRLDAAP